MFAIFWAIVEKTANMMPPEPQVLKTCYTLACGEERRLELTRNFILFAKQNNYHICRVPIIQTPDMF